MRLLIFAVVLTVVQTSPPLPRKAADNQASQTARHQHKTDADQNNATASAPRAQSPSAPQSNGSADPATPGNAEKPVTIAKLPTVTIGTDWWSKASVILTGIYVLLTTALVGVGVFGVCYARRSLRAIESQLARMREQVEEMRLQRREMFGQKEIAGKQFDAMQSQVAEMKEQTDILKTSIAAAKENADAAKATADAALRSVRVQEAQLRQWIDIEEHGIRCGYIQPQATEADLTVIFQVVNNTKMVLTLKQIAVKFFDDDDSTHAIFLDYTLPPENGYPLSFDIPIAGELLRKYQREQIIIPVVGMVTFEDAFETTRQDGFGFNFRCRENWFELTLYEGPIPKKKTAKQDGEKPN